MDVWSWREGRKRRKTIRRYYLLRISFMPNGNLQTTWAFIVMTVGDETFLWCRLWFCGREKRIDFGRLLYILWRNWRSSLLVLVWAIDGYDVCPCVTIWAMLTKWCRASPNIYFGNMVLQTLACFVRSVWRWSLGYSPIFELVINIFLESFRMT